MSITLLEIYNRVAGQSWSKFDGEAETGDDFETNLLSSIQKALSYLWCSSEFPFRVRVKKSTISTDTNSVKMPDGDIHKKNIAGAEKYAIRVIGGEFLDYLSNFEILPEKVGVPLGFFIKNDRIFIYPTPDSEYDIEIEYLGLKVGYDKTGKEIFQLKSESDYIEIPAKYEELFCNALVTLSMCYAIASDGDENYSNYYAQFQSAFNLLEKYTKGVNLNKCVTW